MQGLDIVISTIAFTLFTSAVMAEIVRGGLNSIPRGQFEAAQSQGFGFFATMRYIILPQTFKTIIPALFSQCTTVIKDSSYLSGINVAELMYTANVVMAHAIDLSQVLMLYGLVFAMYFVLNFGISLLLGLSRACVAEFTFYLAIPVMAGASLLKVVKFAVGGSVMTGTEVAVLAVGCVVAFGVSLAAIRFLMDYVKRHDFKFFGVYRIVLGIIVLAVAAVTAIF